MREIKFRSWNKITNHFSDFTNEHKIGDINSNGLMVFMQYTGLKDKNDVEIYEGDIVIVTEEDDDSCMGREFSYRGVVSYGNSLKLSTYAPQYPSSFCLISNSFYKEQALLFNERWSYEVIGNIYENPELLKEDI